MTNEEKRAWLREKFEECPACVPEDVDEIVDVDLDDWMRSHGYLTDEQHAAVDLSEAKNVEAVLRAKDVLGVICKEGLVSHTCEGGKRGPEDLVERWEFSSMSLYPRRGVVVKIEARG